MARETGGQVFYPDSLPADEHDFSHLPAMVPSPELTIQGIALIPIVVAIVRLATAYGLSKDYAPLVTALLTVAGYALTLLVQFGYVPAMPVEIGLTALTLFLVQMGVYSFFKFSYERFVEGKRDERYAEAIGVDAGT